MGRSQAMTYGVRSGNNVEQGVTRRFNATGLSAEQVRANLRRARAVAAQRANDTRAPAARRDNVSAAPTNNGRPNRGTTGSRPNRTRPVRRRRAG